MSILILQGKHIAIMITDEKAFFLICAGNSTILSNFERIPNHLAYAAGSGYGYRYFSSIVNIEEECALLCETETTFTCRAFYVEAYYGNCWWLKLGIYYEGQPVSNYHRVYGDTFWRISTCKPNWYTLSTWRTVCGMDVFFVTSFMDFSRLLFL